MRSFFRRGLANQISLCYYLSLTLAIFGSLQLSTGVLGAPFINSLYILEARHESGSRSTFGSLGWCIHFSNSSSFCCPPSVAYHAETPEVSPINTAPLILHIVALVLGLLSILATSFAHSREEILAKWFLDGVLTMVTVATFVSDVFFFAAAQNAVKLGSTIRMGNVSWLTLLACVTFLSGTFSYAYGRCCARKGNFRKRHPQAQARGGVWSGDQSEDASGQSSQDDIQVLKQILRKSLSDTQHQPLRYGIPFEDLQRKPYHPLNSDQAEMANFESIGALSPKNLGQNRETLRGILVKKSYDNLSRTSSSDPSSLSSVLDSTTSPTNRSEYRHSLHASPDGATDMKLESNPLSRSSTIRRQPSVFFEDQEMSDPPTPDSYRPYSWHTNKGRKVKKTKRRSTIYLSHAHISASVSTLGSIIREFPVPEDASPQTEYRPYLTQELGARHAVPLNQASFQKFRRQSSAMHHTASVNLNEIIAQNDSDNCQLHTSFPEGESRTAVESSVIIMIHSPRPDPFSTPADSS